MKLSLIALERGNNKLKEEQFRTFFANVKFMLNLNLGPWCERNQINRTEFSLFMNNRNHHLSLKDLDLLKRDIISNIESTLEYCKKVA